MVTTVPFKRLILRAVLRQVSPMVIRLLSVPDDMNFPEFHEVIRAILGWNGDLGYITRFHGHEFNSFRRRTRSQALRELKLRRQEKFLYICDTPHLWEKDIRVLDIEDGVGGDHASRCLGGRGAAPPEQIARRASRASHRAAQCSRCSCKRAIDGACLLLAARREVACLPVFPQTGRHQRP
jgi:hypothetical protein